MQLLVLHTRRHLFLLGVFVVLAMMVTKLIAGRYGFAYLFVDPEYAGSVSYVSFYMMGLAFGAFTVLWNITSYILNSHRFPFLATFRKPFFRYCLNNFVIPASFAVLYIAAMTTFQLYAELQPVWRVVGYNIAFILGTATGFLVSLSRSLNTHSKDYEQIEEEERQKEEEQNKRTHKGLQPWKFNKQDDDAYRYPRVDYLLTYPWRIRRVRIAAHYKRSVLISVFRQHQRNALILELIALELIVLMSFLMDSVWFRVPTGVSFFLLFSILLAPVGAFSYWLRTWAVSAFIAIFLLYNVAVKYNFISHQNKAFGLDYAEPLKPYSLETIAAASSRSRVTSDSMMMIDVLENWKVKMDSLFPQNAKHKMVFVNASGGGLRAAVWSFFVMQQIDSVSGRTFLDQSQLVCGASGGTLGQAYFRELYRKRKQDSTVDLQSRAYLDNMSKDLLNAVSFALVVNDLFVPWQKFRVNGHTYQKDRGYLWEKQLNENTGNLMAKRIGDYAADETAANIPIMIFTPTVIDDARRINVSNFPTAYLNRPMVDTSRFSLRYDGIDAYNFFGEEQAKHLLFTTAIRMNATFPYIMPNVHWPTNPMIQTMDAGLRDNYGVETTLRFIDTFKDWINQNTDGVVILQTWGYEKNVEPDITTNPSFMQRRTAPFLSIYHNWMDYQDYHNDMYLSTLPNWLSVPADLVTFEYIPSEVNSPASMSWHLTQREKADIRRAVHTPFNQKQMQRLKKVMGYH